MRNALDSALALSHGLLVVAAVVSAVSAVAYLIPPLGALP